MNPSLKSFKTPEYSAYYAAWKSGYPTLIQEIRRDFEKVAFGSDPNLSLLSVGASQAFFAWIPESKPSVTEGLCCLDYFTELLIQHADYYRYSEGIKPQLGSQNSPNRVFRNYVKPLFRIKQPGYKAGPNLGNVFFECCTDHAEVEWIKITANYYPNEDHVRFEKLIELCLKSHDASPHERNTAG